MFVDVVTLCSLSVALEFVDVVTLCSLAVALPCLFTSGSDFSFSVGLCSALCFSLK